MYIYILTYKKNSYDYEYKLSIKGKNIKEIIDIFEQWCKKQYINAVITKIELHLKLDLSNKK